MENFRDWLREKLINYKQEEFARLVGVSDATVNRWLLGKRKPNLNNLKKIG